MQFLEYKDQFINMTKRKKITTEHSIIQIMITNDEKHALILQRVRSDYEFQVGVVSLREYVTL